MNLKQRIILAITLILAASAGLYPPWKPLGDRPRFHALWQLSGEVDLRTLFTEWAVILFIGVAIALLLSDRRNR